MHIHEGPFATDSKSTVTGAIRLAWTGESTAAGYLDVEGAQRVLRRLATMTEPPTLRRHWNESKGHSAQEGEGEDDSNSDNCDEEGNNENKEVGELDNMIQEEVGKKEHLKDDESNCVSQREFE